MNLEQQQHFRWMTQRVIKKQPHVREKEIQHQIVTKQIKELHNKQHHLHTCWKDNGKTLFIRKTLCSFQGGKTQDIHFIVTQKTKFYVKNEDVLQTISDPALEYKQTPYFGGVLDIRTDNKQYKNKVYEMGTRAFLVTELYRHIPRSCRLFNRWCLVYYTGQPYSVRKKPTQQDNDKNDEETMPSCDAGSNSENGNSDVESSLSFVTVEEKDTSFSLKQNIEREDDEPTNKKQKPDKANYFDMDLMIKQLTAVSREFEEHEFRSIVDVLGEDRSAQIDGVIGSMNCLVKTACKLNNILSKHLVF